VPGVGARGDGAGDGATPQNPRPFLAKSPAIFSKTHYFLKESPSKSG